MLALIKRVRIRSLRSGVSTKNGNEKNTVAARCSEDVLTELAGAHSQPHQGDPGAARHASRGEGRGHPGNSPERGISERISRPNSLSSPKRSAAA